MNLESTVNKLLAVCAIYREKGEVSNLVARLREKIAQCTTENERLRNDITLRDGVIAAHERALQEISTLRSKRPSIAATKMQKIALAQLPTKESGEFLPIEEVGEFTADADVERLALDPELEKDT